MSNHIPDKESARLFAEALKREAVEQALGPTGNFPKGKVSADDEGEIRFAVAADRKRGLVHINFGTPVTFVSIPAEDIESLTSALEDAALRVRVGEA